MLRSLTSGLAWAMILGALTIVVVGFALVPFVGIAVISAVAAAETSISADQVPPAPAQIPRSPISLTGGPWRVQAYNNGQGGAIPVLPDVQLTATFGADGSVNGDAGCNGYRGPYTIAGDRITFGSIVSTRRACLSEALTQQETAFLAALSASTTFDLVGDRLTLRDDAGAAQVLLVRPSIQPVPRPAPGTP